MFANCYPGTMCSYSSNGWSSEEIFTEYFKKLIARLKSSEDDPVLIIFDNHDSHLNPEVLELGKSAGKNTHATQLLL
jgi:uncharacterized Fe-S cluster-containing MiaB family protein